MLTGASCVLREALLQSAPQDDEYLYVKLKTYRHPEELTKPASRRMRGPWIEALVQ